MVDESVSAYFDWSADGRSLVYIKASDPTTRARQLAPATLTRRRILNDAGQIEISKETEELAGLVFHKLERVRCLRDGRIVFVSEEVCLPVATNAVAQPQQLFVVDGHGEATFTPLIPPVSRDLLPASLTYFEISPDEKRIAIGTDGGVVAVVSIASGLVDIVRSTTDKELRTVPSWRSSTELCYVNVLELQPLIDACCERGAYGPSDYALALEPPLFPEDATWAEALLREHGLR